MPKISVIVPVYNVEQYLCRCIDSILAQTNPDFELILIDDGSSDGCPAICDAYAQKDGRVRVIHQKNAGVSNARNTGLDIARGEFITFCDSDDYIKEDCFEVMIRAMQDKSVDEVVMQVIPIKQDGILGFYEHAVGQGKTESLEATWNHVFYGVLQHTYGWEVCCRLFRASIIQDHKIRFCTSCENFAEDLNFTLKYALFSKGFCSLDYAGYYYVWREGSMMRTSTNCVKINALNEVSADFYKEYKQVFDERYAALYPVIHLWLLYNSFAKVLGTERYECLGEQAKTIQNRAFHQKQMKDLKKCKTFLETEYGRYRKNQILLFSRYLKHGNWKRYRIESLVAYKFFIKG